MIVDKKNVFLASIILGFSPLVLASDSVFTTWFYAGGDKPFFYSNTPVSGNRAVSFPASSTSNPFPSQTSEKVFKYEYPFHNTYDSATKSYRASGPLKFPGAKEATTVAFKQSIPKAAQAAALARFASVATPIGAYLTVGSLLYSFYDDYLSAKKVGNDQWEVEKKPGGLVCKSPVVSGLEGCNVGPGVSWSVGDAYPPGSSSPGSLCILSKDVFPDDICADSGKVRFFFGTYHLDTTPSNVTLPTSDLSNVFDPDKSPQAVDDALNDPRVKLDPNLLPIPEVSGPPRIAGDTKTTVTQRPDGKTVTREEEKAIDLQYDGNKITQKETTTKVTTTTRNPDGSISTDADGMPQVDTEITTETRNDEQKTGDQQDILNCEGPDKPTSQCALLGDPPDESKDPVSKPIELQNSPWSFGENGQCMQNVTVSLASVGGGQFLVLDTQKACEFIGGPVRALILLFASITAVMILVPKD